MRLAETLWFVAFVILSVAVPGLAAGSELEVGDPAPGFTLEGSDGRTYSLSDYVGRQAVVIAWFPKAYTRGCTIECKSLAENGHLIRRFDVSYFMASVDPIEDNIGFAEQQKADFPLLSDPTKETARAYGVLSFAGFAKRHTIYIAKDGTIAAIDTDVRPATSAEDIATRLGELGVAAAPES
ncbi:MAG TPA: redoxin domain-containing protein [Pseudomonadales bacterium]